MRQPPGPGEDPWAPKPPEETGEHRPSRLQRALRWISWLIFLGLAIANSQKVMFTAVEFVALAIAIGVSIWCVARPLGPEKVELAEPAHLYGAFVSRTNWALVLIGVILTIGGIGATGAIIYDLSTGRATFGDVVKDILIFIEGWFVELFTGGAYDAELEKTHAYALFLLLIPGIPLVWINLVPFFRRGREWGVERDGSVVVRTGAQWNPLLEYEFATVEADGSAITFTPATGSRLVLPQQRVFSRQFEARLRPEVSADFFRARLARRGFQVDGGGAHFTGRRV